MIYGSGKYAHGLCHIFALGLHHVFGYQIAILEDRDREVIHDKLHKSWPYVPHVFCIKEKYIIDAFGVRSPNTMIKQSGEWTIAHPKIHKIDSRSLYNNSLYKITFERITKKNVEEAEKFILKNRSKYKI